MPPKTVLITGCGPHGIGQALASEFHLRGHRVIATGLTESLLEPLRDLGLETMVMDVTSDSSVHETVAHVAKLTGGKLEILINNAGLLHIMPFADTAPADARRVFDVNVYGTIAVTHALLPLLVASASAGRGDAVVANLGSINTVLRPPFVSVYNAAKAAVEALSASMRAELAPLGVRVVVLKTGLVRTDLFANAAPLPLPADSWYGALREFLDTRQLSDAGPFRYMEPEAYARGVVTDLLRPSVKAMVWHGGMTTAVWLLSWLPETTMFAWQLQFVRWEC
ncbi:short-chain dehydrogenase/reductase [Apiospora kogelbergensis]|uniref:Short-chain dehydrogenase/reductase n=1 Tax=Apiospora kogelbergensis TaxID=1337665 RepID=A0AAW0QHT0_9PEZI